MKRNRIANAFVPETFGTNNETGPDPEFKAKDFGDIKISGPPKRL